MDDDNHYKLISTELDNTTSMMNGLTITNDLERKINFSINEGN